MSSNHCLLFNSYCNACVKNVNANNIRQKRLVKNGIGSMINANYWAATKRFYVPVTACTTSASVLNMIGRYKKNGQFVEMAKCFVDFVQQKKWASQWRIGTLLQELFQKLSDNSCIAVWREISQSIIISYCDFNNNLKAKLIELKLATPAQFECKYHNSRCDICFRDVDIVKQTGMEICITSPTEKQIVAHLCKKISGVRWYRTNHHNCLRMECVRMMIGKFWPDIEKIPRELIDHFNQIISNLLDKQIHEFSYEILEIVIYMLKNYGLRFAPTDKVLHNFNFYVSDTGIPYEDYKLFWDMFDTQQVEKILSRSFHNKKGFVKRYLQERTSTPTGKRTKAALRTPAPN